MMKFLKCLLSPIVLIGLLSICAHAQHNDNVWIFSDVNGAKSLNFTDGLPVVDTVPTDLVLVNGSAMVSNDNGELACYTNGCQLYNGRHEPIENGGRLNPGRIYSNYCADDDLSAAYPSVPHSADLIPFPGMDGEYILLHTALELSDTSINGSSVYTRDFYYSIINMNNRNGRGVVTQKNIPIDNKLSESQRFLNRHANGTDWWVVSPLAERAAYALYLIDSTGISFQFEQQIGIPDSARTRGGGQSVFTPDGSQFLRFSSRQGIQIFDFDRTTGELSNFEFVPFPEEEYPFVAFGGIGVSPSGQFAYVSNTLKVWQYDLWADDIEASMFLVHEVANPDSLPPGLTPSAFNFQLGPDCRLYNYMITGRKVSVIHNPDERGAACNYEQGAIDLGISMFRDQPHFPNFRLGPLGEEGSPCAGPIVSTAPASAPALAAPLKVFPNPSDGAVELFLPAGSGTGPLHWRLYDANGRLLRQAALRSATTTRLRLDAPAGLYFWTLTGPAGVRQRGRLVVR